MQCKNRFRTIMFLAAIAGAMSCESWTVRDAFSAIGPATQMPGDGSPNSRPAIETSADNPKQPIRQEQKPVACRGKVIDAITGRPMAGVYVLFGTMNSNPNSWSVQMWNDLQNRADRYAKEASLGRTSMIGIYPNDSSGMPVYLTNAEGVYEALIMPSPHILISFFAAAPGYALGKTQLPLIMAPSGGDMVKSLSSPPTRQLLPGANGIIEIPAIKMMPSDSASRLRVIFEDENGQVIDQNKLTSVTIEAQPGNAGSGAMTLDAFLQKQSFVPAIYQARAKLDDRNCVFEPADLTRGAPEIVVFTLRRNRLSRTAYTGKVVNGVTGAPVWGAIVINNWRAPEIFDKVAQITPKQWTALKQLGPNPDPNDSAFAPFISGSLNLCGTSNLTCAVTDRSGRFSLTVEHDASKAIGIENNSFPFPPPPADIIIVAADNFIPLQQQLSLSKAGPQFKKDKNGAEMLPILRMPPAAKIRLYVEVPPYLRALSIPAIQLEWTLAPEDAASWFRDMQPDRANSSHPAIVSKPFWRPNTDQVAFIPAGVKLTLSLKVMNLSPSTSGLPEMTTSSTEVGALKIKRGKEKNLGHIKLMQLKGLER
jgi:hypothetical protein